jgi:hypothetical protein
MEYFFTEGFSLKVSLMESFSLKVLILIGCRGGSIFAMFLGLGPSEHRYVAAHNGETGKSEKK